jgi:hypothetical protein
VANAKKRGADMVKNRRGNIAMIVVMFVAVIAPIVLLGQRDLGVSLLMSVICGFAVSAVFKVFVL